MTRRRICLMASTIIAFGAVGLARPAAAAAAPAHRCELKCPSIPGTTFCGGSCDGDQPYCEYVTPGHTCGET